MAHQRYLSRIASATVAGTLTIVVVVLSSALTPQAVGAILCLRPDYAGASGTPDSTRRGSAIPGASGRADRGGWVEVALPAEMGSQMSRKYRVAGDAVEHGASEPVEMGGAVRRRTRNDRGVSKDARQCPSAPTQSHD